LTSFNKAKSVSLIGDVVVWGKQVYYGYVII